MQPASAEGGGGDLSRQLKRYGPLALIAIIVIVVVVVVASSGGDDEPTADDNGDAEIGDPNDPSDPDDPADPADPDDPADPADPDGPRIDVNGRELNDGVVPLSWAREQGVEDDYEWGDRCDLERGTIAVPDVFAVECVAVFDGDNGGSTAQGVTEDTIVVAWYQAQEQDPILNYITSAIINDDTNRGRGRYPRPRCRRCRCRRPRCRRCRCRRRPCRYRRARAP